MNNKNLQNYHCLAILMEGWGGKAFINLVNLVKFADLNQ
jgi:hypothetical protein